MLKSHLEAYGITHIGGGRYWVNEQNLGHCRRRILGKVLVIPGVSGFEPQDYGLDSGIASILVDHARYVHACGGYIRMMSKPVAG